MTRTAYLSYFMRLDEIEAAQKPKRSDGICRDESGPIFFVRAWLAEAAKDPKWMAG